MDQSDFEKLFADTLDAHGNSPSTQETYTLKLRLFGRYLEEKQIDKTLGLILPEDAEAYQRYLISSSTARAS